MELTHIPGISTAARRRIRLLQARACLQNGRVEDAVALYRDLQSEDQDDPVPAAVLENLQGLAGGGAQGAERLVVRLNRLAAAGRAAELCAAADAAASGPAVADELHELLSALVAASIRQARAGGEEELAGALQSLHMQLARLSGAGWDAPGPDGPAPTGVR